MEFRDDEFGESTSLSREELHACMRRSDGPGAIRFLLSCVLFLSALMVAREWAVTGNPAWLLAVAFAGAVLVTFFPALHESGHGTAFRTPWMNEVVVAISAFLMLQAPTFFKEFHWEHHRRTQDRERDPELSSAPNLLADWPSNVFVYLMLVSGVPLMTGKLGWTLAGAVLPIGPLWDRIMPFVRPERRAQLARESRVVVVLMGTILAVGFAFVPGFAPLLLAWPIAHTLLGFYLMAEHTGLPNDGSQVHRTRTVHSNAVVRWWMWNMPYHAEHHVHPAVPFHQVPQLHRRMRDGLEHVSPGYLAFHREVLRRVL